MAIEPGRNLLHYRLVEKIGEGGMGVVMLENPPRGDAEVITHWFSKLESLMAAVE